MNLLEFAKNELNILENNCKDDREALDLQKSISKDIIEVLEVFSKQGHTNTSANYMISLLDRLLRYKPLSALQGSEDEWEDVSSFQEGKPLWQNKRYPSVFKNDEGRVYDCEGKIFSDDNGHTWFTCKDSSIDITFPYFPSLQSERVLKDNPKRKEILISIIENITNIINISDEDLHSLKIIEDTELKDIIEENRLKDLEDHLINEYNLNDKKDKFKIYYTDQIWNIINLIILLSE